MKVIGVDQSLTATAVIEFEIQPDRKLKISKKTLVKPKGNGVYRLMEWYKIMVKVLEGMKADDLLARELHNHMQHGSANQLQELAGFLDLICCYNDFLTKCEGYAMLPTTTWKKFVVGKGNLSKDTAYLLEMNKAINKIDFLVHDHGVIDNDNIADAIGIGVTAYAGWLFRNNKQALQSLTKMDLAVIEKNNAQMFDYGKKP